jgi:Calcineurin-like phosphoesterase
MKSTFYILLPLLLAGFLLPDDNCGKPAAPVMQQNQYDGPYVLYKNNQVFIKYVFNDSGVKTTRVDTVQLAEKENSLLQVAADEPGKLFTVQLKKELQNEKSEFSQVKKMFIVSDIEGNFKAFRKLLQANGIIDEKYNWTFADGHLVLTGDFFDRGNQVTEVLWLIYSLEEKAKEAGGYVHFVLGNHEIMNMNGDIRYVHAKYIENAALMNENYMTLFSENSELGRWLRTKNVVERIGDILFAHGGISSEVNNIDVSAPKINKLARPFYADSTYKYKDQKVELLYSDYGPFWYRGYYNGNERASQSQVDSTLRLYGVKYIATGHTVIADTISALYNGKLFNTDVHHAKGHSEGLLYENGSFFRVNAIGEKLQIGN